MFKNWEGWSFVQAAYFSFITLTTVGFGDLTPDASFTNGIKAGATFPEQIKMICSLIYCSVGKPDNRATTSSCINRQTCCSHPGLATLTTCISLIQEQVAASARRAMGTNKQKITKDNIVIIPRREDIRVRTAHPPFSNISLY